MNLSSRIALALLITLSLPTWSAQITQVKGKGVLIDTQGDSMAPGDRFFAVDLAGKRKAIVTISKVRGDKALGRIDKGRADIGMGLMKPGGAPPSSSQAGNSEDPYYDQQTTSSSGASRMAWGGLLGVSSTSLTADIVTDSGLQQGSASTSSTSFSAMGLFDYQLFDQVWFRGLGGVEAFKTSGPAQCGTSSNSTCDVNIMYLSADAIARYVFSNGNIKPWVGGGVALLFPLSKSSSLLQSSSITSTYAFLFTGGVDWKLNPKMYVPISIEYAMLPKSDTVEASWIQLRFGLALPF